ncbi:Mll0880 protein [Neorhizobium galegae bv. orientalis]|nr:Mll0880 protein [Neorhizobium galegae bv. orientalis]
MSGFRFSFPACVIAGKGRIVADDILMLRKYAFPDGICSSEDALALFALNDSCPEQSPEWSTYFVESLTAYLVRGTEPLGRIDDAKASWLMRTIAANGAVHSALELELLLHAMEVASEVPESLSAFALDQVRLALEPGARGAYHAARPNSPGIAAFDLTYIWRVLRGAMERGRLMLSPVEARVLRGIDELADAEAHHPAWREMIATVATYERPKDVLRSGPWLVTDAGHRLMTREVAA